MEPWDPFLATLDRGLNAAIDITIAKETGKPPVYHAPSNQNTVPLTPATGGGPVLPTWLPMAAMLAAVALVAWKLAK